jgi:hypothetical protein
MAINVKIDLELAYAAWLAEEEQQRQENVVMARKYFEGDHDVKLTERQKEYLGHQLDTGRFSVNYCATIVKAVYERMIVKAFEDAQEEWAAWAWDLWQANRMDAKQIDVYRGAVRDGEQFVFVDWDKENERPTFIPHPRYTDPMNDGDGFGCKAFYPDDDTSQPMERVSKRWTEKIIKSNGERDTRRRMTVYYPDRIEKWVASTKDESGWEPLEVGGEPWPIPWTEGDVAPGVYDDDSQWVPNEAAKPLGIPVVHFYSPGRKSELWDAVPVQDLVNKTALDILATADAAGFPINLAFGWTPTTDGKDPEADGGNYLKIFPGCWIGPIPEEGGHYERIPPEDIAGLLESLDSWIIKLAQVTDTPISRFQMTRQIASEDTQKQQEAVLLAKVRNRQTLFGNGWEDCMVMAGKIARRMTQDVPEGDGLDTLWEPAETRDEKAFREAMMLEAQMGVPKEMLWEKLGYDQDDIARMKAMASEEMEATSNIGGELLRAFEGGAGGGGGQQRGE